MDESVKLVLIIYAGFGLSLLGCRLLYGLLLLIGDKLETASQKRTKLLG